MIGKLLYTKAMRREKAESNMAITVTKLLNTAAGQAINYYNVGTL